MNLKGFFFLLILFSLNPAYGENEIQLEWEEAENTLYYTVDIKKDSVMLFSKRVDEPRLTLELSPGIYEYRLSLYNKFEKIFSQSDWQTLTIIKNIVPEVIRIQDVILYGNDRKQRAILEAVDVMEGALMTLVSKSGASWTLDYDNLGYDRYSLVLDTKNMKPGYYDLTIKNPSGSDTFSQDIIYLKEKKKPLPLSISPNYAYLHEQIPHVYVEGDFFEKDIVVYLIDSKGKKYPIPLNNPDETDRLDLWFDLNHMKKGSYDLLLINTPYEETLWEDCFTIIDERDVRDKDYYEKIRWGTDLLLGIPLFDLIYESPVTNITIVEGEVYGVFPEMELILRMDFASNTPFLKYLGLETRFATFPDLTGDNYFRTYNVGIFGKTHFNSPINILFHGDMGYRMMNLSEGELEGVLFTGGMALQFNYDQWLFEFSARQDLWFLQNLKKVNMQQFSFRTGYRF